MHSLTGGFRADRVLSGLGLHKFQLRLVVPGALPADPPTTVDFSPNPWISDEGLKATTDPAYTHDLQNQTISHLYQAKLPFDDLQRVCETADLSQTEVLRPGTKWELKPPGQGWLEVWIQKEEQRGGSWVTVLFEPTRGAL